MPSLARLHTSLDIRCLSIKRLKSIWQPKYLVKTQNHVIQVQHLGLVWNIAKMMWLCWLIVMIVSGSWKLVMDLFLFWFLGFDLKEPGKRNPELGQTTIIALRLGISRPISLREERLKRLDWLWKVRQAPLESLEGTSRKCSGKRKALVLLPDDD